MKTNELKAGVLVAGMATVLPSVGLSAAAAKDLVERIKSKDDKIRGPAWQSAELAGAPAVKPLAEVMMDPDFGIARAAKRGLYRIVRHAGRPGAKTEAKAVTTELVSLLPSAPAPIRREALWLLSEIAGDEVIAPMAALLADAEVQEAARCSLMRFAGRKATSALKAAFASASEEFKPALAESLRARGVKVKGYPSQKLVPCRRTSVGG